MKTTIRCVFNAFAVLLLLSCMAAAQKNPGNRIRGPVASLQNGVSVKFSTITIPAIPNKTVGSIVSMDSDTVHRVLVDNRTGQYFGYDLDVERVSDSKRFKLSITPLSSAFQQRLEKDSIYKIQISDSLTSPVGVSLPRYPEAQIVEEGDIIKVTLLTNPQTGTQIVDLISLTTRNIPSLQSQISQKPPQDFTLEEIQLSMANAQLFIDGEMASEPSSSRYSGAVLWFYTPEQGRFIFSILPRAGYNFQKIGVIENNKISFSMDGHYYEWRSSIPVLAPQGHWNLWVLRDPDYRPSPQHDLAPRPALSGESQAIDKQRALKGARAQLSNTRKILSGAAESPVDLFQDN